MEKNILILIDNLEDNWAAQIHGNRDNYHLLTFDFSPRQALVNYKNPSSSVVGKVIIVDTSDISRIAEKEAREYYLEFIKEFPKQRISQHPSILETLSYNGRNLWWYLGISEKNIWNDKLVHRLYAFLRCLYTLEKTQYDEVRLYVEDSVLRRAIMDLLSIKDIKYTDMRKDVQFGDVKRGLISFAVLYFSQVCRELAKILLKVCLLKLLGIKTSKNIAPGSIGFFSIFPFWWEDAFSERATEMFFNTIPDEISKSENVHRIVWIAPWLSLFGKGRKFPALLKTGGVTVLETTIKPRDLLCLFDLAVFLKFLRALKATEERPLKVKGVAIPEFIREEVYKSLISPMFFQCLLLDRCLQRVPMENFKVFFLG